MEPVRIEFLMVDKLSARLDKAVDKMEQMTGKTAQADRRMRELDRSGQSLQRTIGRLASAFAMKELVSKIAAVRGEFQQLEVAFKTMLGSAEQADALMRQLTRTAATTPFGLEDVAQGARQLLAYGLEAEKVNGTLIRLGDIAAGLSVPLGDLVYLYGTTMAQGRLYTQDLNQFTGRGIPMIAELAKQFGVAESKVKELVEAGKVGFPEVQKVIESLTDEGGRFGGLMEAQSKTITGQISNIEDAISMMFNELGQQSEGVINTTLSGVSHVIGHYERFGRILLGLVGTYGVYRTAVMTVAAAKGWATAAETLHYNWLLLVEKAQKMLNATLLANPYVLVATLIAGVVAAMVSMKTEAERLKEAEESYEAQKRKVIEAEEEHRRKIEELCSIAGNEAVSTDTRREALNRLEQKYPDIFAKYDTEYEKLKNIKKIKEEIALFEGRQSITNPGNELERVNDRIRELEAKKATERWEDANGSGTRMRKTGGLSAAEEAELKNLRNKKDTLSAQVRKDEVDAYFENLTGVSNDTLEAQIRYRETLLARMSLSGKKSGEVRGNAHTDGTYTREELQYQLNKLRSEQNRRGLPTGSSAEWAASAKKNYQEALKAYNDFLKESGNDLSREEFEKKAKELKDAVDAAKKEYDKVKPGTDSDAEKSRKASEKAAREAEKRKQVSEKLGQELAGLQRENDASEIEAMDEGLQKKLRRIDNDYQARRNEIDKQEADWKRKNKEAGVSEVNEGGLTGEQQDEIDKAYGLAEEKRKKDIGEAYRAEAAAMLDFLKEYGTYQQKKLAITEEYAEKIRKASSDSERRSLGVERDSLLAGVEAQELKADIDWSVVFGEFGGMFHDLIAPELEKAKAYMQTDEFRNAGHDSQEALANAVRQMEQSLGGAGKASFKKLGTEVAAYQSSLDDLRQAQDDYERTFEALSKAQNDYIKAVQSGTKEEQDIARAALDTARANADAAAENVSATQSVAIEAQRAMTATATTLKSGMDGVVDGLRQIASGSLSGAYEGIIQFGKSVGELGGGLGDAFQKVSDAIEDVPIIGWIVRIIDLFKDGLSIVIEGLLGAIFNAVSGIIGDILSGDLFVTLFKSIRDGIGKIFDAITFGGFSSWFSSSNAKEVQAAIDRLTDRNETLQAAIEDLTDEIKASRGTKSVAAYRDAYKYQQEVNANYLAIAQEQAGYHGSHGSWNHYWGGFSRAEIDRMSDRIGRRWNGDIWDLSPEEMKILRSNVDLWKKIQDTGKGGYGGRLTEKLDDYIDQAGKLEELTDQLYEGLTGISFDSMYDSFIDTLMDMDASTEDFADKMSGYFMRAMLSNKIGELYADRLEGWWKKFGKAMEDNDLTEAERNALQNEYMQYVEEAMKLRDRLAAATGYGSDGGGTSQGAKAGGFTAMTQDQGTKLEGMFTSGLQHWSSMDEKMENVSEKMNSAENHLAKIEENTGKSAGHLEKIAENIVKIIRDGLKVR